MLLKIVLFLCGAAVMTVEILASRVLTPEFGDNLQVWGAVIGSFIGALSIGYWAGGAAADRWPTRLALGVVISASGLLITVMVPLMRPVSAAVAGMDFHGPNSLWLKPLLASSILFMAPIGLLGAVSPFCVRLATRDLSRLGKRVGGLYAISSFGSIFGTFLTAFYLIGVAGVRNIILAQGLLLMALAVPVYLAGYFFEDAADAERSARQEAVRAAARE